MGRGSVGFVYAWEGAVTNECICENYYCGCNEEVGDPGLRHFFGLVKGLGWKACLNVMTFWALSRAVWGWISNYKRQQLGVALGVIETSLIFTRTIVQPYVLNGKE